MRLFTFVILLVVLQSNTYLFSQSIYISHGFSSNFTNVQGLNQVVDNYNDTRLWLDKDLKHFGNLDGYRLSFGAFFGGALWTDFEFSFRNQKRKAFGTDSFGNFGTRELKLRNNLFAWTFGVGGIEDKFLYTFGARMDVGNYLLKTRVYYDGEPKGDWSIVDDKHLVGRVGPSLMIGYFPDESIMLNIQMYYQVGIFKTNMTYTDEELNNSFYDYTSPDIFDMKNHVFGISLLIGIVGRT